ncbi:response regulator [Leeia oryzae]|uniref:response regulator n=1 Tax=Leeia oryzae TaxID=356662 RepID=UPI000366CA62|nr:response regulator [Leeia oryzae]
MDKKPINVLLVDDDDVAAEGVMRSLKKHDIDCMLVHAEDGVEALDILKMEHPDKHIASPFLVLLDLNMPRMDGFEFLSTIRSDPALQNLVVFVLTTSSADADLNRAYQESIAGYMVKSAVGPQFSKLMNLLKTYGDAVSLPSK